MDSYKFWAWLTWAPHFRGILGTANARAWQVTFGKTGVEKVHGIGSLSPYEAGRHAIACATVSFWCLHGRRMF